MNKHSILILSILGVFFIFGLASSGNYGVSADEPTQRTHRLLQARQYFALTGKLHLAPESVRRAEDVVSFKDYPFKYYGVGVQYPLILLEYGGPKAHTTKSFWTASHIYTHVIFLFSAFIFTKILKLFQVNKVIIVFSLFLYLLYPRIYANSFYNIKDAVFMSFFTISSYALLIYLQKQTTKKLIILAAASALVVNIRMMGVLIPAYFAIYTIVKSTKIMHLVGKLALFGAVFASVTMLIWPTLWEYPVENFLKAFHSFSDYYWTGTFLFDGRVIDRATIPPDYIFRWIAISSPLHYLALWVVGLALAPIVFIKKNNKRKPGVSPLLFPIYVVSISFAAILLFKSTLYGDWRHLYYIFPMLLIISTFSFDFVFKNKAYTRLLLVVFIAAILIPLTLQLAWMARNHPHHYVYFNEILAPNWDKKWERDIWRLSAKQALTKLALSHDYENLGPIRLEHTRITEMNSWALPENLKERIQFVDIVDADYFLADYRTIAGNYPEDYLEGFSQYIDILVEGRPIASIYKRI